MKTKIFWMAGVVAAVIAVAGCVDTVNDKKTVGFPLMRDSVEGRYERSVDQVFQAALGVTKHAGTLVNEATLYNQTNSVKTIEAKVNQRNVYIRVESVAPNITAVAVQTRTPGGATDINLAHELEKEIALALVGTR
jgi:outer membrane murein-binding lipoprotein Lpp